MTSGFGRLQGSMPPCGHRSLGLSVIMILI